MGHGHADGVAGEGRGVGVAVALAQAVAGGVQAGDDLAGDVEDLQVVVGLNAGQGHEARARGLGVGAGRRVEGRRVNRHHVLGVLAVLRVDARGAQLVVLGHLVKRGLEGVALVTGQLEGTLEGLGGVDGGGVALGDGALAHGAASGVIQRDGLHVLDKLLVVHGAAVVGRAVVEACVLEGLVVVGVGHRGDNANRLQQGSLGDAHSVGLVAVALAVSVEEEVRAGAPRATATATGVHRGAGRGLHDGADPAGHPLAVADAVGEAKEVVLRETLAGVELGDVGIEVPGHLGISAVVAQAEDNALGGLVLHVGLVVELLGDGAGHSAGLVGGELEGALAIVPLGAELLALEDGELHDLVEARHGSAAGDGVVVGDLAHELRDCGVGTVAAAHHGVLDGAVGRGARHLADDLRGVEGRRVGVALGSLHDVDAVIGPGHEALQVVEHLAGVGQVLADDLRVAAATGAAHELVGDLAHVVGAIALVDEPLGVDVADVLALHLAGVLSGLLHDGDLRAALGRSQGSVDAGVAATQDQDLALNRLGGLARLGRKAQPVLGALVVARDGSLVGLLGLSAIGARQRAGHSAGEADGGGAGHKAAPAYVPIHTRASLHIVEQGNNAPHAPCMRLFRQ